MQLREACRHEAQIRVEIRPAVVVGKPVRPPLLDLIRGEWRIGVDKIDRTFRKIVQDLAAIPRQ